MAGFEEQKHLYYQSVYQQGYFNGQHNICKECGRHICSGQMPAMWNECIAGLLVTWLISVTSYEIYILR